MRSLRALAVWSGCLAGLFMMNSAVAQPLQANDLRLSCENGRIYVIHPRGVSRVGELVTGTMSRARHGIYMRLIPMGTGYRYAGRGIWLDGKRDQAELWLSKYRSVACTVSAI